MLVRVEQPFNPLDKKNLGISVADALLVKEAYLLPPPDAFVGAGIYAIYYRGNFPPYCRVSQANNGAAREMPIYVGKAVPAGARRGGLGLDISPGTVLHRRLCEHARSIEQAVNLEIDDFYCRYLVVDDIWIPLGESLLIEQFQPIWNCVIDGFGNHDPGSGRRRQQKSPWDVIHPGRLWADVLQPNSKSREAILENLDLFLSGGPAETVTAPLADEP